MAAGAFTTRAAAAASNDAAATRLAEEAIQEDYVGTRVKSAETKLRRALKLCEGERCSPQITARVYRDLGVVLIAGLKKGQDGREAFAHAVQNDPEIRLEEALSNPELQQAFVEVGGQPGFAAGTRKAPSKKRASKRERKKPTNDEQEVGEDEQEAEEDEEVGDEDGETVQLDEEPAEGPSSTGSVGAYAARANYFSFTIQQDFLLHGATKRACHSGTYTCFDDIGEHTGPVYEGAGNQVGGGLSTATTRLLLGYDRLFFGNVLAGVRLGLALGGGPAPTSTGDGFLPVHFELRGAYHLLDAPFTRNGFRPYVGLGLGVAEVNSKVEVEYFPTQQAAEAGEGIALDAWTKRGKTFFAPTFGSTYAFGDGSSVLLELRTVVLLGTAGFAPALGAAYVHAL